MPMKRILVGMLGGLALLAWIAAADDIHGAAQTGDLQRVSEIVEGNQGLAKQNQKPWPPGWRRLPSPVREGLHRVFFLNDSLGWVLTYGTGTIIQTTDGGESWTVQAKLEAEYFETIQFLDANNGWVCGDYGYVYKTTDGGKTWVDVSPDISGRITDHYRSDPVKSESPPDGWFVVYDPLYFFNVEEGFVCGFRFNPTGRQPRTREGLVFETKAGGQTWARRAVDPQDYLARLEFSERLNCDHRKIGYLFYLDRMTAWKFGGENTILRTTNGGRDWRSFQIAPDKVWFWRGLAFTDEKNGFVIGELSRESARGVLYGTADGGESWVKVAIDCPALHAIALSPSKIYIVGKEGTILLREKSHEKALFCMSGTQEVVELGGKVITPKKGR